MQLSKAYSRRSLRFVPSILCQVCFAVPASIHKPPTANCSPVPCVYAFRGKRIPSPVRRYTLANTDIGEAGLLSRMNESLYTVGREFGLDVTGEESASFVILLQHGIEMCER